MSATERKRLIQDLPEESGEASQLVMVAAPVRALVDAGLST